MRLRLLLLVVPLPVLLVLDCGGGSSSPDGGSDAQPDTRASDVSSKDVVSEDVMTADSGDGGVPESSVPVLGEPPPPPDGGAPTSNVYTFAVETVYLGEGPRGGPPSTTAWTGFGYDIDGLVTNASSVNVCTLYSGAPSSNQDDGVFGIDNAWGAILLPLLQAFSGDPTPSQTETTAIDMGTWTLQIQVTGLSDDPAQDALGLTSQLFLSGSYGSTPAFDTTTDWPVLSTSVKDGLTVASGSTMQFTGSYVSGGTFVSGTASGPMTLVFSSGGVSINLVIHEPVLTFDHSMHASASSGTISGVIDTAEFAAEVQQVAAQSSTVFCGSGFDGIQQQIEQAQDILQNGTNTMGVPCNAISIGLGFDAVLVANPTMVVAASPPPPDPCGD